MRVSIREFDPGYALYCEKLPTHEFSVTLDGELVYAVTADEEEGMVLHYAKPISGVGAFETIVTYGKVVITLTELT